jgi:UDP-N-acetylglucosamine--N-acetylmuramyl-(pentapeptide) pyrophosphoryl-undecaprenol N-acetylglucosamine transferase
MSLGQACIAFTGGGTGGHIYPGIAVIECLRESFEGQIVWIGSGKPIERQAVESAGIEFLPIPSGKLRRTLSLSNVSDAFRTAAGFIASRHILRDLRPALLFSKGGYVSVPPCLAAASLGIPFFTHESDLSPGLATRLNARKAAAILLGWEETLQHVPESWRSRAIVTGNPVRAALRKGDAAVGKAWLGFPDDGPIVLVLGGSQGARQINDLVNGILPSMRGKARIAHQTGPDNEARSGNDPWYRSFNFAHTELADIMAAADIIVGRAGAGTISEAVAAGKSLILVPLTGATRGDQVENARLLERHGAAMVLEGREAVPAALQSTIQALLASTEARRNLTTRAAGLVRADAAGYIAQLILERLRLYQDANAS